MAQFETWLKTDLQRPPQVKCLGGAVFSQDHMGNLVGAEVTDGGQAASLSGTVMGYIVRADGSTVAVSGQCAGNRAWIELPEAAYAVPGMIRIAIRLRNGSQRAVLAACVATVQRTSTDEVVDPGAVVPSLEALLAKLEEMDAAVAEANAAITGANTAASDANAAAARVGTAMSYLAPAYEQGKNYAVGDYMTYNGKIYHCVEDFGGIDMFLLDENGDIASGSWEAVTVSDMIGDTAEDAAAAAADELLGNMTVSASAVSGAPTATLSVVNGHYNLALGLVRGEKGEKGDPGTSGGGSECDVTAFLPTNTLSGRELRFSDAVGGAPVKSLVVDIVAVQEGEGAPSKTNVRPITGWSGVTLRMPVQNTEQLGEDWQKLRLYGEAVYPVGSVITVGQYNSKDMDWDVVDYRTRLDPVTGRMRPCVTLMLHAFVPYHEFDSKEALYYVDASVFPSGMPAGTYRFTCRGRTSYTADDGVDFQFTLSSSVPVDGQLYLEASPTKGLENTYIHAYVNASTRTYLQRVKLAKGSEGTDLGVTDGSTPYMNHIMCATGGSSNYGQSVIRQWINATGGANAWWTPKHIFSRPPLSPQNPGFLSGVSSDFLDALALVDVVCKANNVFGSSGETLSAEYHIQEDKFFLPSLEEVGLGMESAAADAAWAMYDGADSSVRIKRNINSGRSGEWWVRTPEDGTVHQVKDISSLGAISCFNAVTQIGASPACVMWLDAQDTLEVDFTETAGEVYGGSLDVTRGVLTVTKGFMPSYNNITIPGGWVSSMDVYGVNCPVPSKGAQVVYDLADPLKYKLTPREVRTLLCNNHFQTDCGDMHLTYCMPVEAYVEKRLAEYQASQEAAGE